MKMTKPVPVVDVFSGPGGLAEGFSAAGYEKGTRPFEVKLSIEKDHAAYRTLQLRSFFRQFDRGKAPEEYYDFLRGEISLDELFKRHPTEASKAKNEVWHAELGSRAVSDRELGKRILGAVEGEDIWVLVGGHPCEAYSVAGRSRNRGVKDYKAEADGRHFLYREYLRILGEHWPIVFVMENVKGMLSSRVNGELIFDRIIRDLRHPADALQKKRKHSSKARYGGYRIYSLVKKSDDMDQFDPPHFHPSDFVIESELYGIPQARHRVILVGIREDLDGISPNVLQKVDQVPAAEVIQGLPCLRSGLSREKDSPSAWQTRIVSALDRRWLRGARKKAGQDVWELIRYTISRLEVPPFDRGGEFIPLETTVYSEKDWYLDPRIGGVCNSTTRRHMSRDLHRYLYASCFAKVHEFSPRLVHFPPDLLPDHSNVHKAMGHDNFADRFRVQIECRPATTITSHISKDGHYYIHPDPSQCRSLTVREAARLQTFPDNYFFAGYRTRQYVQVGNAVPPLLAKQIAEIVYQLLESAGCTD